MTNLEDYIKENMEIYIEEHPVNRVVLFIVSGNSRIMQTFADRVIEFNRGLVYRGNLPDDFQVMNPFWIILRPWLL